MTFTGPEPYRSTVALNPRGGRLRPYLDIPGHGMALKDAATETYRRRRVARLPAFERFAGTELGKGNKEIKGGWYGRNRSISFE
jgi:hypothetical protein